MTEPSTTTIAAQLAVLTERIESQNERLIKMEDKVDNVRDLLARARGATWLLAVLAAAGTLFNLDAIRGLFK